MPKPTNEQVITFSLINKRSSDLLTLLNDEQNDIQLSIACTVLGRLLLLSPEKAPDLLANIGVAVGSMTAVSGILPSEVELLICVNNFDNRTTH